VNDVDDENFKNAMEFFKPQGEDGDFLAVFSWVEETY